MENKNTVEKLQHQFSMKGHKIVKPVQSSFQPSSYSLSAALQKVYHTDSLMNCREEVLLLQSCLGNQAVINLLQAKVYDRSTQQRIKTSSPKEIKRIAEKGVTGKAKFVPYLDKLQRAFGSYDLSKIRTYSDIEAKMATKATGAEAYTTDNKIAFADSNPSLHTVAHEVAHTFQRQKDTQLNGDIGKSSDFYEQQADTVANAVVQGESAEPILNSFSAPNSSTSAFNTQAVQFKLKIGGQDTSLLIGTHLTDY